MAQTKEVLVSIEKSLSENTGSSARTYEDRLISTEKKIDYQQKVVDITFALMVGVVLVLFVTFIGIFISICNSYSESVKIFNDKVDQLNKDRYELLKEEIDLLKENRQLIEASESANNR